MNEPSPKPSRTGEAASKSSHPYNEILQLNQELVANLQGLVDELNLHGRSGYGTPRNDPEYAALQRDFNVYQRTLGSITFYKSIAFVRKKEPDEM